MQNTAANFENHETIALNSEALSTFLSEFTSCFFTWGGKKMHYIDSGHQKFQRTILCLHSRFTYSFAYRNLIPKLVQNGWHVIAPDLIGFGLSDNSTDISDLSIKSQSLRLKALIDHLNIEDLTIIANEMSVGVASTIPRLISKDINSMIFANPITPIGKNNWSGLHLWRALISARLNTDVKREIRDNFPDLDTSELHAYVDPFLQQNGLAGLHHFHKHLEMTASNPDADVLKQNYQWLRDEWHGNSHVFVGNNNPIFGYDNAKIYCDLIGHTNGITKVKCVNGRPFEEQSKFIDLILDKL